jgi:hypothetical protein
MVACTCRSGRAATTIATHGRKISDGYPYLRAEFESKLRERETQLLTDQK